MVVAPTDANVLARRDDPARDQVREHRATDASDRDDLSRRENVLLHIGNGNTITESEQDEQLGRTRDDAMTTVAPSPPTDPLTAAGIPESIKRPDEAAALVKLIEERVPKGSVRDGHPLTLPHWYRRWLNANPQWDSRGREICGDQTVALYEAAMTAMRELLATGAPQSSSAAATGAVAIVPQPEWTRRRPRVGPRGVAQPQAALNPAETIVHPMEAVALAALIVDRVPAPQITFAMKRLEALLLPRASMDADSPERRGVDVQIIVLYPTAFNEVRNYLTSRAHEGVLRAEDEAAARALEGNVARFGALYIEPNGSDPIAAAIANSAQSTTATSAVTKSGLAAMEPEQLVGYVEQARDLLAKCQNISEAKGHLDKAKAVSNYLQSVRAAEETQSAAEEVVVRVRRRLGELLREVPKARAGRKENNRSPKATYSAVVAAKALTLTELGITKQQASKLEMLATIPAQVFEGYIDTTRAAGKKPTTRGALALAKTTLQAGAVTESYTVAQAVVIRKQWSAITRLHADLERTAMEWSEEDAIGMGDNIAFNTALAATIGKAIEMAPAARRVLVPGVKKARSSRSGATVSAMNKKYKQAAGRRK